MTIAIDAIYEDGVLKPDGPLDLPERARVHLVIDNDVAATHTALGAKLRALREQILATGEPTLGWSEISEEVTARRRGYKGAR